jgi:hypothetical protein
VADLGVKGLQGPEDDTFWLTHRARLIERLPDTPTVYVTVALVGDANVFAWR